MGAAVGGLETDGLGEDEELAAWRQSLNGSFPSRLDKLRSRLIAQRDAATAVNVRGFIGRKIKILNELLDGPMPEPEQSAAPKPARLAPKPVSEPTDAELLETGLATLAMARESGLKPLLTAGQKAALQAAGKL